MCFPPSPSIPSIKCFVTPVYVHLSPQLIAATLVFNFRSLVRPGSLRHISLGSSEAFLSSGAITPASCPILDPLFHGVRFMNAGSALHISPPPRCARHAKLSHEESVIMTYRHALVRIRCEAGERQSPGRPCSIYPAFRSPFFDL